jgi:hypothetical protein
MTNSNRITLFLACCLFTVAPVVAQKAQPTESKLAAAIRAGQAIPVVAPSSPHAFSFVTREGNGKEVISCGPMAISADGVKHFHGLQAESVGGVTAPPPIACTVTVLARSGDTLRVKIDATRSVAVTALKDKATWVTQNHSTIKDIAIGESATIKFLAHAPSSTVSLDLAITAHAMADFLAVKDVMEFAK